MKTLSNVFVVLTEDAGLIDSVRSVVADSAVVHVASDISAALAQLDHSATAGLIVDGRALSGHATVQLSRLRQANPLVSILFVASELRASLLNDIQPLRIELVAQPLPPRSLEQFVRRTLSTGRLSSAQVGAWIEHLALAHKLNGSDLQLFPLLLERETREELCARLSIDQATLARDLRRLVKKCRVRNTDRLAKNVMRDALLFGGGVPVRRGVELEPLRASA